jgi:hypothetical protein
MITEDYVSFETARLLKEKGFDAETEHEMWYVIKQFSTGCHWNSCTYKVGDVTREYDDDCCISMPTLQMAMKWLRENHNLVVNPVTTSAGVRDYGEWEADIYYRDSGIDATVNACGHIYGETYEEACDAGIRYCLENLI